MEQETKIKKQPNLKRVILWTTLISVVAMLVLYYFSYVFPIPAVELETTVIPQSKEEYEQKVLKDIISKHLAKENNISLGDKIIQLFDIEGFSNNNFGVVHLKSGQYWLFARFSIYNQRINADETIFVNFPIDGSEVIGTVPQINNDYIKTKFLVFNRNKEKVFYYNHEGNIEKIESLSNGCKIVFSSQISSPRFVLGKDIFLENSLYNQTIDSLKDWNSNDSCVIKNVSDFHAFDIYVISKNIIKNYHLLSDISIKKLQSSASYTGNYSEISFGLPILNSKDGVYFFDVKYSFDKKSNSIIWLPEFVKILDEPINKDSILYSDLDSMMFGKQIGGNFYVYYIDCRDYAGKGVDYDVEKFNVLMWKFVVPGKFKWYSDYSNIICTDKGIYTFHCIFRKLYSPYQMYFDLMDYYSKLHFELKTKVPLKYIKEYPHILLFGNRNYAHDKMLIFLNSIYENVIKNVYSILAFPILCIALFLLSRTEEKNSEKKS